MTCGLASFFIYTKLQVRKAALDAQPTAKEKAALEALKRLNSFLDIGINFSDYSSELREAKAAVDQIDTTSLTKDHFEQAVQGYSLALDWWKCDFEYQSSQYDFDSFYGEPKCRDALLPALTDYSETMKKYIAQGIEYNISVYGQDSRTPKTLNWDKHKVLQKLWVEAEYHVEDAEVSLHEREKLLQEWWK